MAKRRHKKRRTKHTRSPLVRIMLFSFIVLASLIYISYRNGDVRLYQDVSFDEEDGKFYPVKTAKDKKTTSISASDFDQKQIRVLLSTTGFAGKYHQKVTISGTEGMSVIDGRKSVEYPAGKSLTVSLDGDKKKVTVKPLNNGKLTLHSIKRQNRNPVYRGTMVIRKNKQGLTIVNHLSVGQYLAAVVPSELSTSNKLEALKAQAVCARSYAYRQMNAKRFKKYHADVDDSVSCQVYNNIPEDKRSRKAVKATSGEVVTSNDQVISTYYYSTSWGKSASGKEVWGGNQDISYLKSCVQTQQKDTSLNLSTDTAFRKFLEQKNIATYDSEEGWYRWIIKCSASQLSQGMDARLLAAYQTNPKLVLTQDSKGKYASKPLQAIGQVKKIRVEKREKSGLVTQVVIVGTNTTVKVCDQYHIRNVLASDSMIITKNDGKEATLDMLPSAAFVIDSSKSGEDLVFVFRGGGFGHGTGMSQTGAAVMAKLGSDYKEILEFYFSGCSVCGVSSVNHSSK